ncbi:MAG: GntR family transcriptional regulator [Paucimonas sp.]|jgi:putative oxidoreductase|nr:GntR family transcriptional regulator [Paucimonas sp.]
MSDQYGKLVLRVVLSAMLLFHGVSKLVNGIGPISGMVANAGMPPQLAWLVYVGEVLAPVLILLGIWTRLAALVVVGNMVVALALVHGGDFVKMSKTGGWALELQAFYLFVALAIALLGAGRFSVAGANGRLN